MANFTTKISGRVDYSNRLNRVTSYIYDHLDDAIDLNQLASVACLSSYHWHRIYHAMHGETIAATVRRLRLHRAAGFLANTSMTIEAIALKSGYASVPAFSRAFQADYEMPPAQYRDNGAHASFKMSSGGDLATVYDVDIRQVSAVKAVAIDHLGSYMQIGKAFDPLFGWCAAKDLLGPASRVIGIFYDDPFSVEEKDLRSRACIVVNRETGTLIDEGEPMIHTVDIPQGTYAVLRHRGPYATMPSAYQWIYGTWLMQSGEEPADAPVFEEYLNNPRDTAPSDLLSDIYLPLAR